MTTDEPDEQLDPVSPEDDARVRELLSGARETGPMPATVVARLDEALAGLAAGRAIDEAQLTEATGYGATVHPITRSRRHRVVAVLGAAAAVAVVGLGIGAVIDQAPSGDDDSTAADSGVDRGAVDEKAAPTEAGRDDSLNATEDGPTNERITADRAYRVRSRHLSADLARIQRTVVEDRAAVDYRRGLTQAPEAFACSSAHWGRAILVGVTYDGDPAYVAFREPMGDSQVVEVLQCGTGDLLRSTTLPTDD